MTGSRPRQDRVLATEVEAPEANGEDRREMRAVRR